MNLVQETDLAASHTVAAEERQNDASGISERDPYKERVSRNLSSLTLSSTEGMLCPVNEAL